MVVDSPVGGILSCLSAINDVRYRMTMPAIYKVRGL